MKIRPDQLTIGIADENDFVDWYIDEFMPDHLPTYHEMLSRSELVGMVKAGRREAIRLGFVKPGSQVHFVTLMWKIGPSFYMFPGFAEVVADKAAPESERVRRLYEDVTPDQAADAILGADDWHWVRLERGARP